MFSSIKSFLHRHKRKFLITGAVIGGAYLLTSYAQKKLRDWQEKEAKRFLEMTRKKQLFESTTRTCNQTILSLSKIVTETILKALDIDEILLKLKENPNDKIELWEQMKIMIFTRICVIVYALGILQVMLRIQLNIIAGYQFKDSIYTQEQMSDGNLQAQYLSLCHHFVANGVRDLIKQIETAVKRVVEPVSFKKKVTLQEVEQMFWSIQTILCTDASNIDPVKQMTKYLTSHTKFSDARLDTLVRETIDILESDEVMSLTMASISRSFSSVMDVIANDVFIASPQPATNKNQLEVKDNGHIVTEGALKLGHSFVDVNKIELHFVKVITHLNKLITENSRQDTNIPEMLTQQLILNEKSKILGANIYEAFSSP